MHSTNVQQYTDTNPMVQLATVSAFQKAQYPTSTADNSNNNH